MESNLDTNLVTFIVGVFTIALSLVAILVSVVNSIKSDLLAHAANETAKRALEISLFSHKKDIMPKLVAKIYVRSMQIVKNQGQLQAHLVITNESNGKALIYGVEATGHLKLALPEKHAKEYPVSLLFNNSLPLTVTNFAVSEDQRLNRYAYLVQAKRMVIRINYTDEIGNRYYTDLRYDNDSDSFKGVAKEISQPPKETAVK